MTYGEFKNRVLQLIFSYSIAGDEIPLSYNNQEDYVKQIPGLLSTAQSYVYQHKRIEDAILMHDLTIEEYDNDTLLVWLPDDCLRMKPGLIVPRGTGHGSVFRRFTHYKLFGGNRLMVPKGLPENTIIEYERCSLPIPPNVLDEYVLRNPEYVNDILPFYVAAFVVLYDDPFRYAALYNEFETRLQRLTPNPTYVEESPIEDVYFGFRNGLADEGYTMYPDGVWY